MDIIEAAVDSCLFIPGQLQRNNTCRTYLEEIDMDGIATGDGKMIKGDATNRI